MSADKYTIEFRNFEGRLVRVTLNRAAICEEMNRRLRKPGKGGKRRSKATILHGAIVAHEVP